MDRALTSLVQKEDYNLMKSEDENQLMQQKYPPPCTANIYDQITMELQPFIVVVRRFTGDINYSAKYGSFLYETVKLRIN